MRTSALLGFVLCLGVCPSALAQDPDDALRDQLYEEGRTASDAQRWDEAAQKFRRVVEIRASSKASIALAVVENKRARVLEARDLCRRAVELAQARNDSSDRALAEAALADVEKAIPTIHLELPPDVSSVDVDVDGKRVAYSA